jgi:NADPH:quinone reductase-like Zn-dependent oxidoreductase
MRGAGIVEVGGTVEILDLDEPGPLAQSDVLIRVRAAGVGNWDELVRVGDWDVGRKPPMALGVEAAGVVEAVGAGVTAFAPGDEVLTHPVPLRQQGTWADTLVAPAPLVARKPPGISWRSAATFPVPALTAEQVVADALGVSPGESVLVHGAGGVTGGLIVQLALARGATVTATAGPSSRDRVLGSGAQVVLDHHDPEWPARARESSNGGRGFSAAANAARGGAKVTLAAVADGGRLATITGDPPQAERGVFVSNVYVRADGARLARLAELFARGELAVPVPAVRGLEEAGEALGAVVAGRAGGAIVLSPSNDADDA